MLVMSCCFLVMSCRRQIVLQLQRRRKHAVAQPCHRSQAAFILAPSVKVKIGGGFNMPSAACFRVGVVFLIGAR
jgi:hypothetical protein